MPIIKVWLLVLGFSIGGYGVMSITFGQSSQKVFQQANFIDVLQTLENETAFTFNYDPQLLLDYTFTGTLNLDDTSSFLHFLFMDTPFAYEKVGETILISLPPKQIIRICGHVTDQDSGQPLPYANVFAQGTSLGTQTNLNGQFEFELSAHKNQEISISYVGYALQSISAQEWLQSGCQSIKLQINEALLSNVIIVHDYLLDGVTEGEAYGSIHMDYHQLDNWQTNIEHDLLKTVQFIPGVNSFDESATNLSIRGSSADQNLLVWEGAKLYDAGHLFGMISAINPFVIDQMKVFKGVFEPKYENVIGGVIDMSLSNEVTNKLHGGLGTTLTEAHGYLGVPLIKDRLSLLVSGRHTVNPLIPSPTLVSYSAKVFQGTKVVEDEEQSDQVLQYHDWNAKLLFKPTKHSLFQASYFNSTNGFNYFTQFSEEDLYTNDEVSTQNQATSLSYTLNLNEKWEAQLRYTRSSYENDYAFLIGEWIADIDLFTNEVTNSIVDESLAIDHQISFGDQVNMDIGYEYNHKAVNFAIAEYSPYEQDYAENNANEGHFHNAYASLHYQYRKFQLNGGVKLINWSEFSDWSFSPRVSLQQAINPYLKLKCSAGILQQYVSQLKEFGDNQLGVNNQVWVLNQIEEEEHVAQRAQKMAGGLLFQKGGILIDMEGYFHQVDGLHTLSPIIGTNPETDFFSIGSSTTAGLDLLCKKRWDNYHIWINYTLSKTAFHFPEVEETPFPATHDQRHVLRLLASWKHMDWNFSLSYQYKSALPFSQPSAILSFEEEADTFYEIAFESLNNARLNHYNRFDLGVSYRRKIPKLGGQLEAAFSIINLFDQDNLFERNFYLTEDEESHDEPEIFEVEKYMLGFTPQLLVRMKW